MANSAQGQGPYTRYAGDALTNGGGFQFEYMSKSSMIGLLVAPFIGLALFCFAYALQSYNDDEFEAATSQWQQFSKRDQGATKGPTIVDNVGQGYELLADSSEPC